MSKKNAGKAPSYQMYPKDWNEDTRLKMCSYAAQGLWIRLINTTYDMPEKGVFRFSNRPLTVDEILSLLPGNMRIKKKAFQELLDWKVIKQFKDKSFYCQRLHKDMKLREIRKEAGSKGGNPNLVKDLDNQKPNQSDKQTVKQKVTPSTSTSKSTSFSSSETYILNLNLSFASFYSWMESEFKITTKRERGTFTKYSKLYAGLCHIDKNFNARMIDKLEDMKKDASGDKEVLNKMFVTSINNEITKLEIPK